MHAQWFTNPLRQLVGKFPQLAESGPQRSGLRTRRCFRTCVTGARCWGEPRGLQSQQQTRSVLYRGPGIGSGYSSDSGESVHLVLCLSSMPEPSFLSALQDWDEEHYGDPHWFRLVHADVVHQLCKTSHRCAVSSARSSVFAVSWLDLLPCFSVMAINPCSKGQWHLCICDSYDTQG